MYARSTASSCSLTALSYVLLFPASASLFRLNLSPPQFPLPRLVRWLFGRCLARQARARSILERANPITAQGEFKRALSVSVLLPLPPNPHPPHCPLSPLSPPTPPERVPLSHQTDSRPFVMKLTPFSISTRSLECGATGPSSNDFSPYYEESVTATAARASPT